MDKNAAYDISDQLPTVDSLDEVQAKLKEKRKLQEARNTQDGNESLKHLSGKTTENSIPSSKAPSICHSNRHSATTAEEGTTNANRKTETAAKKKAKEKTSIKEAPEKIRWVTGLPPLYDPVPVRGSR